MKREKFNNFIGNMVLFLGILLILPLYLLCVVLLFPVRAVGWLTRKIMHRFFPGLRVWKRKREGGKGKGKTERFAHFFLF